MPTLARKKHPSVHFFLHGPRLFHLSTEKNTVRSVGNGRQSGYSRADTKKETQTKDERDFHTGKIIRKKWKNKLSYRKIKFIKLKSFMFTCCIN